MVGGAQCSQGGQPPTFFFVFRSPQGVTTDDMVAALGLSHAELVTAINELLASVSREGVGWGGGGTRSLVRWSSLTRGAPPLLPSCSQHKLGAHRHADGRELFKAKKPEEGQK